MRFLAFPRPLLSRLSPFPWLYRTRRSQGILQTILSLRTAPIYSSFITCARKKLEGAMVGDGWYNCAVLNDSIVASIDIKKGDEIVVGNFLL